MTLVSSTITNWAEASMIRGSHLRIADRPYVFTISAQCVGRAALAWPGARDRALLHAGWDRRAAGAGRGGRPPGAARLLDRRLGRHRCAGGAGAGAGGAGQLRLRVPA